LHENNEKLRKGTRGQPIISCVIWLGNPDERFRRFERKSGKKTAFIAKNRKINETECRFGASYKYVVQYGPVHKSF
jgi:hypothetical protein